MTCLGLTIQGRPIPAGFAEQPVGAGLAILVGTCKLAKQDHAAAAIRLADAIDPYLPFGPNRASADQVGAVIARDPSTWKEALLRVEGCAEIVVTATWDRHPDPFERSVAASWLRARATAARALAQRAAIACEVVLETAKATGLTTLAHRCASFGTGADIALLVPRCDVALAQGRLARLRKPGFGFSASGPWPCFSFGPAGARAAS